MQRPNCMLMIQIYFYLILMQIIIILKLIPSLKELSAWFQINKLSLNNTSRKRVMWYSRHLRNCIKLVLNDIESACV